MSTSHVPSEFEPIIHDISDVMKLYAMHIELRRVKDEVFHFSHNTHTIVAALEMLFYCGISRTSGAYFSHEIITITSGGVAIPRFKINQKAHSWLTFKEDKRYIIDVIPCNWMKEMVFAKPVFLNDCPDTYQVSGDVDPRHWTPLQKKKMHADVNSLASLFEDFLSNPLKVK